MSSESGKNRRRDVLSLPRAQIRIILVFGILALVYGLVNVYVSKYAFTKLADAALHLQTSPVVHRDLLVIVYEQEATLELQLSIFTFLSFCMLCLAGVLISHRLGGPIYHLKKYIQDIITGAAMPRAVKFRKDDFFHDLAESFNRFQEHAGILKPNGERRLEDK